MYGSRQVGTFNQGWVAWFCQKAVEAKLGTLTEPFTISGTGKQVRDVLHADDMKRLYTAALANIGRARGKAFNVGGGIANSLSLIELFAMLETMLGVKLKFVRTKVRESDQRVFVADIKLATELLGWQPTVPARQGVSDMLAWVTDRNG